MTGTNGVANQQDGRNTNPNVDGFHDQGPPGRTSMSARDNNRTLGGNAEGREGYLGSNGLWVDTSSPSQSKRKSWRDWKTWRI
jgi:hypothetical protein